MESKKLLTFVVIVHCEKKYTKSSLNIVCINKIL